MEDWCAEGIFLMFQVFEGSFEQKKSFVRKKLTKHHEKVEFYCLISFKFICFNAVEIGRSFVEKTNKNTLKTVVFYNLKT